MFYVYLIKSTKDYNLYIGCAENLEERLKKHNQNLVYSTRNRGPFELVYFEAYRDKHEAFQREQNLKLRANALTGLKRRISKSIGGEAL